jgi:phosphatidylglycerophosphate synthase
MRKLSIKYENPVDNFIYIFVEKMAPYMNKFNITPNMITTLGNVCWIYAAYLVYNNEFIFGSLFFGLCYYFDCLDGYVARKYNQLSLFGDYYDHISDAVKGISFMLLLYYKNKNLFIKLIPLIIIFSMLTTLHLSYQEKLHNKKKDSPTLSFLHSLIPDYFRTNDKNKIKKRLSFTKFFGTGSWNLGICIIIIFYEFSKTTRKK